MRESEVWANWVSGIAATVAAAALTGGVIVYGEQRAVQTYIELNAQRMSTMIVTLHTHGELLSSLGTMASEDVRRWERLEDRIDAIAEGREGDRWTAKEQELYERMDAQQMAALGKKIESLMLVMSELQRQLEAHIKDITHR